VQNRAVTLLIDAPNLTHLIIEFEDANSCTHFLAHISVDLQYLEAKVSIHNSIGPPNDPEDSEASGIKKDLPTIVEPFVLGLCAILGPDAEGRIKFPNLRSSRFHLKRRDFCRSGSYVTIDEVMVSETSKRVPVMEDSICNMLERRSKAGAIQLMLKDSIQVAYEASSYRIATYSCEFELVKL